MSAIEYAGAGLQWLALWFAGSVAVFCLYLFVRWLVAPFRAWDREVRREPETLDLTGRRW